MEKNTKRHPYDYFSYFVECAELVGKIAEFLDDAINHFDPRKVSDWARDMHHIENEADNLKHEMIKRLSREFISPIEREDIVALAEKLDSSIDTVEDVMQNIYIHNVEAIRSEAVTFTKLIVKCSHALLEATREFKNFKKSRTVIEHVIEVNTIESDADRLFTQSMRRLFTEETDARTLLIWSTMFNTLEACLDAFEDTADIIESIIMKNT
ncbi:MAG: DUF47 family protein [Oscillospiraceae bacterium]|jgi:predicted phosphate transport protein (TIGR00153 family)|nr:DUF47 family protein [Oscillospiraceae bacterium]